MLIWIFFVLVCGTQAQSLSAPFTYILYNVHCAMILCFQLLELDKESLSYI
jgi:hypothetical protein